VSSVDGNLLIADAVKILSLPIICRRPGPNGSFSEAYFVHTLGYCFAGSTLMGQNAILGLRRYSRTSYRQRPIFPQSRTSPARFWHI
jgi:hypothetical protein